MLKELWDSEEARSKRLRERLQAMTDEELLDYGRGCRRLAPDPRVSWEPRST
jgi:hypothetical protein